MKARKVAKKMSARRTKLKPEDFDGLLTWTMASDPLPGWIRLGISQAEWKTLLDVLVVARNIAAGEFEGNGRPGSEEEYERCAQSCEDFRNIHSVLKKLRALDTKNIYGGPRVQDPSATSSH